MTDKPPRPAPRTVHRPSAGGGRGRPKDLDKRAAILAAAKAHFAHAGLAGTSMDVIAAAAGVSKLTLYSHFRNKDDLFQQAIIAKCREHTPDALFDHRSPAPLRERLLRIGQGFVALVNSPEATNLYRLMAAQGGRVNKLGKLFWDAGPERAMTEFAQLLTAAAAADELQIDDPRRAAAHFFCLLKGEPNLKHQLGAAAKPRAAELAAHVEDVVALFLRAYAPLQR